MFYPGIDELKEEKSQIFRSVGNQESGNQIGFGFMHKKGITVDEDKTLFPYYSCSYIIRGSGTYVDGTGKKHTLSSGSLFQRFPGKEHSTFIDPDSDWAECFIDFGVDLYKNFLLSMNIVDPEQPVIHILQDKSIEENIWTMMKELEISPEADLPDLLIRSLTLLRSLLWKSIHHSRDNQVLAVVEQSCRDFSRNYRKRIDLKQYCREKGIGYESFRKHFKRITGLSPVKYMIRKRTDMACNILLMTEKPIGDISHELGYKSQYEFSAQFKEITGVSPREYRLKK